MALIVMFLLGMLVGDVDLALITEERADGSCVIAATEKFGSVSGKFWSAELSNGVRVVLAHWPEEWCSALR